MLLMRVIASLILTILAPILQPKFYSKYDVEPEVIDEEVIEHIKKDLTVTDYQEKYKRPVTENQK